MHAIAPQNVADLPIVAYVCTDEGAQVARRVVDQAGVGDAALKGGGLSGAARLCVDAPMSKMLLTEMGNMSINDACECVREIRQAGSNVIVLGHDTDLATYRALRQSGAAEYFQFPVTASEILGVHPAQPTLAANDPSPIAPRAFTIGVIGATGGVGASVLAQNLAFVASRGDESLRKTALVDGDILFGSQTYELNCNGTPGFIEALASPDRVDGTFLGATMETLSDTLSLYSHHSGSAQDCTRFEAALPDLMKPMRAHFQSLVLDLPRRTVMQNPAMLEHMDAVLIVFPAGFSGVNAAARLMSHINKIRPEMPAYAALSNLRKDAALSRKEIVQALGFEVDVILPRSEASIAKAQSSGKSLILSEPRSPYTKTVKKLWAEMVKAQMSERVATHARKGLLRRIFS